MHTIACLSQKGGVGKSTISRLVATAYAHAGWKVKIADLNTKQTTAATWAANRMERKIEPEVPAEAFRSVERALTQRDQYHLMVFDGRPDSETAARDAAKVADLILVPTSVSDDDLRPQVLFAHELIANGIERKRILFVINKSSESAIELQDARAFVTQAGYQVCEADLPEKTGYRMAQNGGKAVCETTFPSLNDRALQIVQEVIAKLTELTKVEEVA